MHLAHRKVITVTYSCLGCGFYIIRIATLIFTSFKFPNILYIVEIGMHEMRYVHNVDRSYPG